MRSVQPFISELIRAANEVGRLAMYERSNLLQRAAATIRDYREKSDFSGSPAIDSGPGEIIHDLRPMADQIQDCADEDVTSALLRAADTIKTLKILSEENENVR